LAATEGHLSQLKLFDPIRTRVQIKQKPIKYMPVGKLSDYGEALLRHELASQQTYALNAGFPHP
jgi:hypothetical protein